MAALSVALAGFGLSLSLIVAIGAQNAYVLRQALRREHVGAVVAVCAGCDVLLMALGVSGVAAAVGAYPGALQAVAWGGAAFLVWYGWGAWRRALHPGALQAGTDGAEQPLRGVVLQALAVTLLNPHVYLDTVLLVGAVGARQPDGLRPVFAAGAASASVLWFSLLGWGGRWLAPLFARPAAWRVLDGLVGATMWVLAVQLAAGGAAAG